MKKRNHYDLLLVGTGFASSFFLLAYLKKNPEAKILVLERGQKDSHQWRIENHEKLDTRGILSSVDYKGTFENLTPNKPWIYTPSFGGSSNCWWACTPRFMPNDFKIKSLYDVGMDWPISYEELEPFYVEAEQIMNISGSQGKTPFPMSAKYPQEPHLVNSAWEILQKKHPEQYFPMPTARARRATKNRAACCATGTCALCPIDSKFTILNELSYLYERENVELLLGAQVTELEIQNNLAQAAVYKLNEKEFRAGADLVVLGANPIFNANILLNSGFEHPQLGANLTDHVGFSAYVDLAGIEGLNASSSVTGNGYPWYDGNFRKERASCLIESINNAPLRIEKGKLGHRMRIKFVFEDLPQTTNAVSKGTKKEIPKITFSGHSSYVDRSISFAKDNIESLLSDLPVEKITMIEINSTEGHIMGTARMGDNESDSVVDKQQISHKVRNLVVTGGSSFPSISAANPTLTIAALSLRSATYLS